MKPIDRVLATRVQLVERRDIPGRLGVYRAGARFVCPLPAGYDGRTSCVFDDGYVLVGHPDLPPLMCDPNTGTVKLIDGARIEAKDGRIKLATV